MICDYITLMIQYLRGDIETTGGILISELWNIFSIVNGNPNLSNYGVRLFTMLFFAVFLIVVIQIRTKITFDKKHLVMFAGTIFLLLRICTMLGFEWGWQIGIYDDSLLHLLSPPLEHFWNMLFFSCVGYYTLNLYEYYPGLLKKIIYGIPVGVLAFFAYSTYTWKVFFLSHLPTIMKYNTCASDWQNHLIIAVMAFYIFCVAIMKYKKYHQFISAFWTLTFIEHFIRFIAFYNGYEPPELATIFHSMATWSLPLLILHFVNAYSIRMEVPFERRKYNVVRTTEMFVQCYDCPRKIEEVNNEEK